VMTYIETSSAAKYAYVNEEKFIAKDIRLKFLFGFTYSVGRVGKLESSGALESAVTVV